MFFETRNPYSEGLVQGDSHQLQTTPLAPSCTAPHRKLYRLGQFDEYQCSAEIRKPLHTKGLLNPEKSLDVLSDTTLGRHCGLQPFICSTESEQVRGHYLYAPCRCKEKGLVHVSLGSTKAIVYLLDIPYRAQAFSQFQGISKAPSAFPLLCSPANCN